MQRYRRWSNDARMTMTSRAALSRRAAGAWTNDAPLAPGSSVVCWDSMLDADEGRLGPGLRSNAIAFVYNRAMMPIVYAVFRRAVFKRRKA
jgi:hypothetical protein